MDDAELEHRLDDARRRVQQQSAELRRLRRAAKEGHARASAAGDRAVSTALRAQGHPVAGPAVPTHVPGWLQGG